VLPLLLFVVLQLVVVRDVDNDDGTLVGDDFAFVDVDDDDDDLSCRCCKTFRVDKVKPDKRANTIAWGCTAADNLDDGSKEIAAT